MDKEAIKQNFIAKMEEIVTALREQLEKNEGSTLSVIASSAKMGYESLKATVMGNETAREVLEKFQAGVDDFQTALKDGDRKLSSKTLEKLERLVKEMKDKNDQPL